MLIQFVLLFVFSLSLVRVLRQKSTGRIFQIVSAGLILLASYVVAFPSITNRVAAAAGVGRGVDLIIYLCLALGAYVLLIFYLQVRRNELNVARLVQLLAIETHRIEELEAKLHATQRN